MTQSNDNSELPKVVPPIEMKTKKPYKPSKRAEANKKLADIPIANELLYKETAARTKSSPKQVEECVKVVGQFVAGIIKKGAFETVMLPYFGKFRVKTKAVQWSKHRHVMATIPTHLKPKDETI
jgi:nucleoid DNA-binding protein